MLINSLVAALYVFLLCNILFLSYLFSSSLICKHKLSFISVEVKNVFGLSAQDINSTNFYKLDLDILNKLFHNISNGQKVEIISIIKEKKDLDSIQLVTVSDLSSPTPIIEAVVQPSGLLRHEPSASFSEVMISDSVSKKKKKKKQRESKEMKSSADGMFHSLLSANLDDIIDIKALLNVNNKGIEFIYYIENNGRIEGTKRSDFLDFLFDKVWKVNGTLNLYPPPHLKSLLAKSIIQPGTGFPCLGVSGDDEHSWSMWFNQSLSTGFIQNRLNKLREQKLTPSRKRRHRHDVSEKACSKQRKLSEMFSGNDNDLSSSEIQAKEKWMNEAADNDMNEAAIHAGMAETFRVRREWMEKENPSTTLVLLKYKHLGTYGGLQLSEEFARLQPKHHPYMKVFGSLVPSILQYAEMSHKSIYNNSQMIINETLRATSCLLEITAKSVMLSRSKNDDWHYLQEHKKLFSAQPCCALIQIIPEGVDVKSYESKEVSFERNAKL